ncbi:DUF4169 family protein [Frigidibacter sp. ROC022]|uniref:DUF4169 family protein n=1 Tax=Frigidibacter sp. ROC022 TaxID=2971796 RepID=UPI00215B5FAF|nr:DUF4169 family protein [Frigidibacter sp. ROC022]MCR8723775.1 DUF4169 family protein [Frigidibacter sp. ROC022]
MSDDKPSRVVSLARARKARLREAAKAQADSNALKFGRSKAERILEASRTEAARRNLDQHRLEDE